MALVSLSSVALQNALNGLLLIYQHAHPESPVACMEPGQALEVAQSLAGTSVYQNRSLLSEPLEKVLERFRMAEPIRQDPANQGAWLIYADWLTEQGDPRGELIFLESGLKATQDEKEKTALQERKTRIETDLAVASPIDVRRSVFCSRVNGYWDGRWVCCEGDIFLERIFESEDARFLRHLTLRVDDLSKVRAAPCLASLWGLDLSGMAIGPDGARILAETPWLRSLRVLVLDGTDMGPEGLRTLLSAPFMDSVRELSLRSAGIEDQGTRAALEAWAGGRDINLKI